MLRALFDSTALRLQPPLQLVGRHTHMLSSLITDVARRKYAKRDR